MIQLDQTLLAKNKGAEIISAYSAPDMMEQSLKRNAERIPELAREIYAYKPDRLLFIGSGASYCTLYTPHLYLKSYSSIPNTHAFGPVLVSDDEKTVKQGKPYAVLASYSGKTADTVAASAYLGELKVPRLAISKDEKGPLAKSCENVLTYNDTGLYTSAMANVLMLSAELQKLHGETKEAGVLVDALKKIPDQMRSVVAKGEKIAMEALERVSKEDFFYVLGDGALWGLAYQYGYTNLMEYSRVHASCLRSCEWRHGPLEMLPRKPAMIMFIADDKSRKYALETKAYCEKNGGSVITFDVKDYFDTHPVLAPYAVHIVSQLFLLYQSTQRGIDMDEYLEMHIKPYKPGETYF